MRSPNSAAALSPAIRTLLPISSRGGGLRDDDGDRPSAPPPPQIQRAEWGGRLACALGARRHGLGHCRRGCGCQGAAQEPACCAGWGRARAARGCQLIPNQSPINPQSIPINPQSTPNQPPINPQSTPNQFPIKPQSSPNQSPITAQLLPINLMQVAPRLSGSFTRPGGSS
eukprot:SAG31_NODE_2604_length_5397_cov_18.535296_7_plen_171_part_00